jgi:hypothetical protein
MPLDYLSVKQQIEIAAQRAPAELDRLNKLRNKAKEILGKNAANGAELRIKVELAAAKDKNLRAAKPTAEEITEVFPLPEDPKGVTVIAADGSQISPSRHEAVNYFLINVGAIQMLPGSGQAPTTDTYSELHVQEYSQSGSYSNEQVSQLRDKAERVRLLEMIASTSGSPVITLVDGPLELWGGRDRDPLQQAGFLKSLEEYLEALKATHASGAMTAGYEDKTRRDLVLRCIEIGMHSDEQIKSGGVERLMRGVTDRDLFTELLNPGERSALFEIQHQFADQYYAGPLALHFFYLKVGSEKTFDLARVEIPAWVANDKKALDILHATLVDQARLTGSRPYPYALHRAHEIAVVSFEERQQLTQMLIAAYQAEGVTMGMMSNKQALKDLERRRGR